MDWSVVAGDFVLTAGTVATTVIGVRTRRAAHAIREQAETNADTLDRIEATTSGDMDERIHSAVKAYVAEHPHVVSAAVMDEAIRDVLDAIIRANLPDDDLDLPRYLGGQRK